MKKKTKIGRKCYRLRSVKKYPNLFSKLPGRFVAIFFIYSIRRKISSNCLLWSFDLLIWFVAVNIRILKIDKIRILAGRSLARFFFFSLSKYSVSFTNFERKCRNFCCCQIVKLKVCRESTYYIRQSTCACLLSMSRADSLARPLPCFWCLSLGSSNTQCRILEKKVFKNCPEIEKSFAAGVSKKDCWKSSYYLAVP